MPGWMWLLQPDQCLLPGQQLVQLWISPLLTLVESWVCSGWSALTSCQHLSQVLNHHLTHAERQQPVYIGHKGLDDGHQTQTLHAQQPCGENGVEHGQGGRNRITAEQKTGVFQHPSEQFIVPPGAQHFQHMLGVINYSDRCVKGGGNHYGVRISLAHDTFMVVPIHQLSNTLRHPGGWYPIQDPARLTDICPIRSHICRVGGEMLNLCFFTR